MPLYLQYIPSVDYGAWQATGNILLWLTVFDPGISAVLSQRVATTFGTRDTESLSGWIASGFWCTAAISAVVVVAGVFTSYFLAAWMRFPQDVDRITIETCFRWSVVGVSTSLLAYTVASVNQGMQSSLGTGILYVSATILRLVLVIILLKNGYGLYAIAFPSFVMGLILLVGNLVYLHLRFAREGFALRWAPTRIRELGNCLSFSALGTCSTVVANNLDLLLVARLLGPENVNVLRFTRTSAELGRLIVERPFAALQPGLAHLIATNEMDRARNISLRILSLAIILIIMIIGGGLIFNDHCVRLWVGEKFYAGTSVNLQLFLWFFVASGISMLSSLCFAAGNIRGNSVAAFAQAVIYIPLLWAGGHWFGMEGILAAGTISILMTQGWYIPRALSRIFKLKKMDGLRLLRISVEAGLVAGLLVSGFLFIRPNSWMMFLIWACGYSISFVGLIALLCPELRIEVSNAWTWSKKQQRAFSHGA